MLVNVWTNRKFHSLLVRVQHGVATLKDSLEVSYKMKYTFTIQSSKSHALVFNQMSKLMSTHKKTFYVGVCRRFIHKCPNFEATKMSFNGKWKNKPWCLQTMKYYSMLKCNEPSSPKDMEEPLSRCN